MKDNKIGLEEFVNDVIIASLDSAAKLCYNRSMILAIPAAGFAGLSYSFSDDHPIVSGMLFVPGIYFTLKSAKNIYYGLFSDYVSRVLEKK